MNLLGKELDGQVSLAEEVPRHPEELLVILLPVPNYQDTAWRIRVPLTHPEDFISHTCPTLCEAGPKGGSHF